MMMRGLESIALAAAQLEYSAASTAEPPMIPPKQTLMESNTTAARTVSMDSAGSIPSLALSSTEEEEEAEEALKRIRKKVSDKSNAPPVPGPEVIITQVGEFDVLCGRGGETNHHSGNVFFRSLVKNEQLLYLKAKRRDKPLIARYIVDAVREKGGHFLKRIPETNNWTDVGNNKAREKTSQALREGAPDLRVPGNVKNTETHDVVPQRKKRKLSKEHTKKKKNRSVETTGPTVTFPSTAVSPTRPAPVLSRPHIFTVSSTEEDDVPLSDTSTSSAEGTQRRGPRLKLLKARLNDA